MRRCISQEPVCLSWRYCQGVATRTRHDRYDPASPREIQSAGSFARSHRRGRHTNCCKCILPRPRILHNPAKGLQLAMFLTPFQNKPATVRTVTRHAPPPREFPWLLPVSALGCNSMCGSAHPPVRSRIRPYQYSLSLRPPTRADDLERHLKDVCIRCAGLGH